MVLWVNMKGFLTGEGIKQFSSYFGVGGAAALVEWGVFFLLIYFFNTPYIVATVLAFIVSTTVNWILGRMFAFKNSNFKGKKTQELVLVFIVSAIGLIFNMILMYMFVSVLGMNSNILKTVSKVLSTGIVFFWNFLSRKYLIYKD